MHPRGCLEQNAVKFTLKYVESRILGVLNLKLISLTYGYQQYEGRTAIIYFPSCWVLVLQVWVSIFYVNWVLY